MAHDAVMPVETYRLTGDGLEVQYWRGRELRLEFADAALSELSGRHEPSDVTEPGIGIRVDAEHVADCGQTTAITLLVPKISWTHMESPEVDLDGVLIVTRAVGVLEGASHPHQRYVARPLTGTAAWRVWPGA